MTALRKVRSGKNFGKEGAPRRFCIARLHGCSAAETNGLRRRLKDGNGVVGCGPEIRWPSSTATLGRS